MGRALLLVAASSLAGLTAGCSDTAEPGFPQSLVPSESVLPDEQGMIAQEFVLRVRPRERRVWIERIENTESPGLTPQSIDDLNIVSDGTTGSGPQNTVELVTNDVTFGSGSWTANVTLRQFYTQSLANTFVQVTEVTDMNDAPITGHGGINSDASEFNLSNTYGLWKYTAPAWQSAGVLGILGQAPDNAGARDWTFADPDGAETNIYLRAVSSLKYANYNFDFSSEAFVDACATGTNLGPVATSASIKIGFPFTLYGSVASSIKFNKRGIVTFGTTASTASGDNQVLPTSLNGTPKPAVFAFWDNITYNTSNSFLCHAKSGVAPTRKFIVTWKNMTFGDAGDTPASLTFSVILSEGTNNIDMIYDTMDGPTSRACGTSATVGVQNETATVATSEFNLCDFGSGNAYAFIPTPL
jgi:hypothetical protein